MVKTAPNSPLNLAMISSTPIFFFFVFFISTIFPSSSSSPVSISLSPNILTKSGNSVRVQWTGIDSPSNLDWLGIYSPPDSSDENFIGYVFLSSCENWQSGSCSIDLPLVNLRSNYEFRIFRWTEKEVDRSRLDQDHNPLPGTKHLLGKSEKLGFESGRGPEQIHLSFTTKDDEMRVMFITADGKENFVKYGDRKDGMDKVVGTEVTTYKRSEMCDSPANESIGWRDPGFIHDGVLRNLKRGRRYYYKVEWAAIQHVSSRRILGSIHGLDDIYSHPPQLLRCSTRSAFDLKSISLERPINGWIAVLGVLVTADAEVGSDGGGWSETHSFVSRDWASDETIAFLFGDMGTSTPYSTFLRTQEESKSTIKWIIRDIKALGDKPAFISHIGDISYARGFSWLWDTFFTQIEPVASKVPYHVCIGNHEYDWPLQPWKPDWAQTVYKTDGGGECGVPYSLKFNMPGNSSAPTGTSAPATRNLFYSFDAGVVHFMYMSTETNFLPGSDQYNFIKHDLETIDRKKTPFVVVQGHRPMYTTSNEFRDAPLRERLLEHYEPLFVKNKVTLALWGHVHRYERFCPMKNFTCGGKNHNREDGEHLPVHAVIGMGGQDWQPIWEPRPDHPKDPIFPQPDWSLYRGGEFGYTRLLATKEKLTLSYVGNHDGEVHDVVEIPAPGRVLSSGGSSGSVVVESTLSLYVKGGSVLVLGAFLGYVIGFISRARKEAALRKNWIPVKSEET